jgi:hypothetical protein
VPIDTVTDSIILDGLEYEKCDAQASGCSSGVFGLSLTLTAMLEWPW